MLIPLLVGQVARAGSFGSGLWVTLGLGLILAGLQVTIGLTLRGRAARAA